MDTAFKEQAKKWHEELPGLLWALLEDHGVSPELVDRYLLGWDGELLTVPVPTRDGRIAFFERWHPNHVGVPVEPVETVELFGQGVLDEKPAVVVFAEGIHEVLVLQGVGLAAVGASGTGRYFKGRDWSPRLGETPEVLIALKRGERCDRRLGRLSRMQVVEKILSALPNARATSWPTWVDYDGGAFEFLVRGRRTAEALLLQLREQ